jgi:hypothetical protein
MCIAGRPDFDNFRHPLPNSVKALAVARVLSFLAVVTPSPKLDPGKMRESNRPAGPGRIHYEEAT